MFQVAAISVATEPVSRIRSANLRDPTQNPRTPPESAETAPESAFEDPAAVVHIGAQARALARRDSTSERASQRPAQNRGAGDSGPLAEAARSAAQARASAVERAEEESSGGIDNPLAEAASSAAEALWGDQEEDGDEATNAAGEAEGSPPGRVRGSAPPGGEVELSAAEKRKLDELQQRDREVRQQEQSQATSAQFTGPVRYEYRMGPDGKLYAVEGSAPVDVRPVEGDPVATLRKMEAVERAARQSAEPSIDDQQVVAEAARLAQRARAELAASRYSESRDAVDARRAERTRETEQQRDPRALEARGPVQSRSTVDPRAPAAGVTTTAQTPEARGPATDVLSSSGPSVEQAIGAGTNSTAPSGAGVDGGVDLALDNPGATPPALRRYEEQQRPGGDPGGGFQLVA